MELQEQTLIGTPIPFDTEAYLKGKDLRDLEHSKLLEQKTYIFKDADGNEYANIFLLKTGINRNNWGVGLETFEERSQEFMNLPILIDPDGKVHASNPNGTGKFSLKYIQENSKPLVAGLVTELYKYDTDGDGKNDLLRGMGMIPKEKVEMFHNALAKGINESSPTLQPLNWNEPATKMLTYKPVNVVFTKNGAYLEHAKIKALCKGSSNSCSNALAASRIQAVNEAISKIAGASWNNKNDVSLIQLFPRNGSMSSNEGSTNNATSQTSIPANAQAGQPVINIYGNSTNPNAETKSNVTATEEQKADTKPTPDQLRITELEKENKIYKDGYISGLRNEIAPIDLFEGKEEDQKAFLKVLGEDPKQLTWFRDVCKTYVPKAIALYMKANSGKKQETGNEKKDEPNPAVASLSATGTQLPNFSNDTNGSSVADYKKLLMKKNLTELTDINKRLMRGNEN